MDYKMRDNQKDCLVSLGRKDCVTSQKNINEFCAATTKDANDGSEN